MGDFSLYISFETDWKMFEIRFYCLFFQNIYFHWKLNGIIKTDSKRNSQCLYWMRWMHEQNEICQETKINIYIYLFVWYKWVWIIWWHAFMVSHRKERGAKITRRRERERAEERNKVSNTSASNIIRTAWTPTII